MIVALNFLLLGVCCGVVVTWYGLRQSRRLRSREEWLKAQGIPPQPPPCGRCRPCSGEGRWPTITGRLKKAVCIKQHDWSVQYGVPVQEVKLKRIYVASSWRNEARQQEIVRLLRAEGYDVYDFRNPPSGSGGFGWRGIDEDWSTWSPDQFRLALSHPLAEEGYAEDKAAMDAADACVLVLPCGRSAHTEAGFMAGEGKPVVVWLADGEPELMYKIFSALCVSPEEVVVSLGRVLRD